MRLIGPINSGAAVGGDEAATVNADSTTTICGRVAAIYVKYNDSPPATTDVVIATKGNSAPATTLLTLTDKNTSGLFLPRTVPHDATGVALAALTVAEPWPISDIVNVLIDDANAGDNVDVWIFLE